MRNWIILLTIALSACAGTPFKWDDARRIQAGMSAQELKQLMGEPQTVRASGDVVRYVWVEVNSFTFATKSLAVDLKDGKVVKAPPIPDEFR